MLKSKEKAITYDLVIFLQNHGGQLTSFLAIEYLGHTFIGYMTKKYLDATQMVMDGMPMIYIVQGSA